MNALVVGHAEPAAALTSALNERGIGAELHAFPRASEDRAVASLAESLVELERRLADERPALAVGVGTGDASLALAITAAKLGVPLVAWVEDTEPEQGQLELAERRILSTLADLDAGPVGDGAAAFEAAERISSWANLNLGR
jgi:UDP-N-acetylglucosamine:LPS N-acetylglucosamine transferase